MTYSQRLGVGVLCSTCILAASHLAAQGSRPAATTSSPLRQTAYLRPSNPQAYAHFGEGGILPGHTGQAVAISADGTTIAVGAPHEGSGATGINGNQSDRSAFSSGAVYVFVRAANGWAQQAYVKASNAGAADDFGSSVALSADGNTLAVAAHWESSAATGINGNQADNSIPQAGAVYVFTRTGTTWRQQAYVKASNTGDKSNEDSDGDEFGFSIALSHDGNTLAVGAISEDSAATGINGNQADNSAPSAGAVYVFTRAGTTWSQQAYIKSDAPAPDSANDMFGFAVALNADGNTLAVGDYDEGGSARVVNGPVDNKRNGSGAVYVFSRAGTTWSRQAYLKASISEGGDSWGVSVAVSDDGNTLATGSADEDCLTPGINPRDCDRDIEGAPGKAGSDTVSTGAIAVFVRSGTTWAEQAILKASTTDAQDWFGVRVALNGDGSVLAAGAPNEGSASRGINGKQDDNSATEAGAAYLFTRTGTTWSQSAYVKSSNAKAYDEFGGAVALNRDGRLLIAGAKGDDSGTIDESGAAYVFTR